MKFTKMQGAGNDYIYVDARGLDQDWPQLSRAISDRHFGVGSDGLILIMDSDVANLRMRMFNADGSEGEMCGNGIRCFAKYAIERGIASPPSSGMTVETASGIRTVMPVNKGNRVSGARVSMGRPRLDPLDLPVNLDPAMGFQKGPVLKYPLRIQDVRVLCTFVSMGNPHAVTFLDQPVGQFPLHTIGPLVERHPMFPRLVNFEIVNLVGPKKLIARVWERGSGETMACGTGACAIAVAGRLLGLTGDIVDITLPGGILTIQWDGAGEVFLEGPAEEVFSGEWGANGH